MITSTKPATPIKSVQRIIATSIHRREVCRETTHIRDEVSFTPDMYLVSVTAITNARDRYEIPAHL